MRRDSGGFLTTPAAEGDDPGLGKWRQASAPPTPAAEICKDSTPWIDKSPWKE